MNIKAIAIFCGSKEGGDPLYAAHATALGQIIAAQNLELIYGGGRNGLMGKVADSTMNHKGIVRGVIPQVLVEWETQHEQISELVVVEDMHVRKRKIFDA